MRQSTSVWQGRSVSWQPAFIREHFLPLGHAAWQGYVTHGRGLVACEVNIDKHITLDWDNSRTPYSLQYIPEPAVPDYLQLHRLSADYIHRVMNTMRSYSPDREILISIEGNGAIEIDWLQNLAIAPPDCHRQVCDRWDEFELD